MQITWYGHSAFRLDFGGTAVLMHRDAMKPPSERKVAPAQRKRRLP